MEAAQSTKYFEVMSYLSRVSVYEVRPITLIVPHHIVTKKYYGAEASRGHGGCQYDLTGPNANLKQPYFLSLI